MVTIKKIDKERYNKIIKDKNFSFSQQSAWGDFKIQCGEYHAEYYKIVDEDSQVTIGAFQNLYKLKTIFKIKVNYIPRAFFLFDPQNIDYPTLQQIFNDIKKIGLLTIIEFDNPYWILNRENSDLWKNNLDSILKKFNLINLNKSIQPNSTFVKNVSESLDLFSTFNSKNALRNTKKGIRKLENLDIEFSAKSKLSDKELDEAENLIKNISEQKHFLTRDKKYLNNLQNSHENTIWLEFRDKKTKKLVLVNLGLIDGGASTYRDLYVGRKLEYDKYYISNVLKYKTFEHLQKIGIKYYDHWGIDLDPNSPKYKFTLFKMQFGGQIINYPFPIVITKYKYLVKLLINLLKLNN